MRASCRRLAPVFLSLVFVIDIPSVVAQTTFSNEIVASAGYVGLNPSLALAPDDSPVIAYQDNTSGWVVMLAQKTAGVWTAEQVSIYAELGPPRALALTTVGDPVVAFGYNQTTRAGKRTGGTWSFEDYDSYAPWFSTLAMDSHGQHHVAYSWSWGTGIYQGYLYYDHENISITAFIQTNCSVSLAMDSVDRPHLLFTPVEGAPMEYWSKLGPNWTMEALPIGTWGVLLFDAADAPHIVYYDQVADDLVYGVRSPGGWLFQAVDTEGDVGKFPALALDASGQPHVSYHDVTHGDLKYAVKKGGAWERVVVDAAGDVGRMSSIALIAGGIPAIAYFDGTHLDLKYAVAVSPVATHPATLGSIKAMYQKR